MKGWRGRGFISIWGRIGDAVGGGECPDGRELLFFALGACVGGFDR